MGKVMLTVELDPSEASMEKVRRKLDLKTEELDSDFGVVELDRDQRQYAVLVDEGAASRVQGEPGVTGPHSNPRIETFGSPRASN